VNYGVNTLIWTGDFGPVNLSLLPKIKEGGFDGVEIARFAWQDYPAGAIRKELEASGLRATVCTALTGSTSLVSDDAATRQRALTFLEEAVRSSAELGAEVVAGPVVAPVGQLLGRRRTGEEWKRAVEGLQALTATLDECRMQLAVEPLNRFETYFLNTIEDGVRLCGEVNHPRVGLLYDTFHANIEEKDPVAACLQTGKYLFHVHTCENDRGTPGSGHVPWRPLMDALKAAGYDRWLVIESFGSHIREIAAAACIWRDLAGSMDEIAFDGVRFLKSL
jgi:D-psicose/D-tagatose/L-ribulose 3-epimerase